MKKLRTEHSTYYIFNIYESSGSNSNVIYVEKKAKDIQRIEFMIVV